MTQVKAKKQENKLKEIGGKTTFCNNKLLLRMWNPQAIPSFISLFRLGLSILYLKKTKTKFNSKFSLLLVISVSSLLPFQQIFSIE